MRRGKDKQAERRERYKKTPDPITSTIAERNPVSITLNLSVLLLPTASIYTYNKTVAHYILHRRYFR